MRPIWIFIIVIAIIAIITTVAIVRNNKKKSKLAAFAVSQGWAIESINGMTIDQLRSLGRKRGLTDGQIDDILRNNNLL